MDEALRALYPHSEKKNEQGKNRNGAEGGGNGRNGKGSDIKKGKPGNRAEDIVRKKDEKYTPS